jgi:hypothetical protein
MDKFLTAIVLIVSVWTNGAYAQELHPVIKPLLEKYHEIESELKTSAFGLPIHLESYVGNNSSHVDISGCHALLSGYFGTFGYAG